MEQFWQNFISGPGDISVKYGIKGRASHFTPIPFKYYLMNIKYRKKSFLIFNSNVFWLRFEIKYVLFMAIPELHILGVAGIYYKSELIFLNLIFIKMPTFVTMQVNTVYLHLHSIPITRGKCNTKHQCHHLQYNNV